MPDPRPSEFEEYKRGTLKMIGLDEKRSVARALSYNILWALDVGIRGEILRDMVVLLEFEIERLKA